MVSLMERKKTKNYSKLDYSKYGKVGKVNSINSNCIDPVNFTKTLLNSQYKRLIYRRLWDSIENGNEFILNFSTGGTKNIIEYNIKVKVVYKSDNYMIVIDVETNKKHSFNFSDLFINIYKIKGGIL